ncbi:extracellular serine proteinase-like [Lytechinus variegatus]|uniref:extracellular serine proteinase-like n=1 Tax=Lytechinus variegatus TaxID=7654 RepID=UPI001BB21B39|nr:extracellular serine proteinase-like [Lytechinus variegatus]
MEFSPMYSPARTLCLPVQGNEDDTELQVDHSGDSEADIRSRIHEAEAVINEASSSSSRQNCQCCGAGVDIFLLDTGVHVHHKEFDQSRVKFYYDAITTEINKTNDRYGHGTAAASVVVGLNKGIAPGAKLHSIRVAKRPDVVTYDNDNPVGEASDILEALDEVRTWKNANPNSKCVLLYEMSGIYNSGITAKLSGMVDDCVVVVPAGNNNDIASRYTPGRMSEVITVGATNRQTKIYSQSNYGSSVDIYAPGRVEVASHRDNTSYVWVSGTSFSTAAVAGAAAIALGNNDVRSPHITNAVKNFILTNSSRVTDLTNDRVSIQFDLSNSHFLFDNTELCEQCKCNGS